MRRARATLALIGALAAACSTEEIELRASSAEQVAPAVLLEQAEPTSKPAVAPSEPSTPILVEASPGRDGILLPSAQLPPPPAVDFDPLPESERGCRKLDLLFVIDDSSSMSDEQSNLSRSFPGFIAVLEQLLDTRDTHIMVVSTSGRSDDEDEPALDAEECEEVRGAGRRSGSRGDDCGIAGGLPYMSNGQPDLAGTFACVAQQGTRGSAFEAPVAAALAATGTLNAAGRCNAGFLRPDALLIVTLITDEEDERSDGDPEEWRSQLLAVKGGDEDALVLLGLLGDNNVDGGLLGGECGAFDADGAPRLQELVLSVGGTLGSVCAPDYAPFFQVAAGAIDNTCHDFTPPSLLESAATVRDGAR